MNVNSNEHDTHKGKKGSVLNLPSPILLNKRSVFQNDSSSAESNRRNYMLLTDRKDGLIDWMKEMLFHSFVLNEKETYCGTMMYFEELIEEHRYFNATDEANYSSRRLNNETSRLKQYVPTVGRFFTSLPLHKAFKIYDEKYFISERNFVAPSFNEIRHILNLAQIMVTNNSYLLIFSIFDKIKFRLCHYQAIGRNLQLISFDGDQTLYSDGGNFEDNDELASAIILLLKHNVKVALITAAGYGYYGALNICKVVHNAIWGIYLLRIGNRSIHRDQIFRCVLSNTFLYANRLDGSRYAQRLRGLLDRFIIESLDASEVACFYVFGGECNYLLQCNLQVRTTVDNGLPTSLHITPRLNEMYACLCGTEASKEVVLIPIPVEVWQAEHLRAPKPFYWPADQVTQLLDIAEGSMYVLYCSVLYRLVHVLD